MRGITNNEFLTDEKEPNMNLFFFKKSHLRYDELIEESINWEDDNGTMDFTLNQTKENGEFRWKVGVAIVPREIIDIMSDRPNYNGLLSYERREEDSNPYHGNILLHNSVSQKKMKNLAGAIASYCIGISFQKDDL